MNPVDFSLIHEAIYEDKTFFSQCRVIVFSRSQHPCDNEANESFMLKTGALMYQFHMKPEVVLLSGFGFRLGCLESLLRSAIIPIQSLINQF